MDLRRIEKRFYLNLLQGLQPGDFIIGIDAKQGAKTGTFLKL